MQTYELQQFGLIFIYIMFVPVQLHQQQAFEG